MSWKRIVGRRSHKLPATSSVFWPWRFAMKYYPTATMVVSLLATNGCMNFSATDRKSQEQTSNIADKEKRGSELGTTELEEKYQDYVQDARTVQEIQERLRAHGFTIISTFADETTGIKFVYAEGTLPPVGTAFGKTYTRLCVVLKTDSIDVLVKRTLIL